MDSRNSVQKPALIPTAAFNTGATEAVTEIDGLTVDLQGTTGRRYRKARLVMQGRAVNTSNRRFRVFGNFQDSTATGSGWTDFGATFLDTQFYSSAGGVASGTIDKVVSHEVDLTGAERYLRIQVTPRATTDTGGNTSATGGTLTYSGVISLFDANVLPASG